MAKAKRWPLWRMLLWPLLLYVAAMVAFLAIYGVSDNIRPAQVGIVFGSGVRDDGKVSPSLSVRLDRGLALYHSHMVPRLIVSGGDDKNGYNEAHVMRGYLLSKGMPSDAVIMEDKSKTTWENAKFSAVIMRAHGWSSATVISEYFHIYRCYWFLKAQGFDQLSSASAVSWHPHSIFLLFREVAAVTRYTLFPPR